MARGEIRVLVERAAHNAFRELAKDLWDRHGLCVNSVKFSWLDVSSTCGSDMIVGDVEIASKTIKDK